MIAYVFQAALLCEHCAIEYKRNTANPGPSDDSDVWPQGPYAYGGGEADSPQHCDFCNAFLENVLTPDGDEYLREKIRQVVPDDEQTEKSWPEIAALCENRGHPVLADWIGFYL